MIPRNVEVHVEKTWQRNSFRIALAATTTDGRRYLGAPVVMEEMDPDSYVESTIELCYGAAQSLMDELWRCGLRPSEGSGSAGSLAATERHLKDMQTIALGLLRKDERI